MSSIERVIYRQKGDLNIKLNERRVSTVMDGKNNEFHPSEIRLLVVDQTGSFGQHYREYDEVWGFLGEAEIILEDVKTKERITYSAENGTRIFIPCMVASRVNAKKGTCIVTCAPESADREKQTHKYEIN